MLSGVSELSLQLVGFCQSPRGLSSFSHPSRTGAPSLRQRYPASSLLPAPPPPCQPRLALAGSRLACARHRQGFPCCFYPPLARRLSPIPRRRRPVLASFASRSLAAFPDTTAGRPPRHAFRGLLGVPVVTACVLAESPTGDLVPRSAAAHFVPSMRRSDCFRPDRQSAGRVSHPLGFSALSRRTLYPTLIRGIVASRPGFSRYGLGGKAVESGTVGFVVECRT